MSRFLLSAAFSLVALAPAAHAQMMGQTLDAEWHFPSFGSVLESHVITVSSGVELPNTTIINDTKFEIDLGDDWVEFRFNASTTWSSVSFNGWLFRDALNGLPLITGYSIDSFSAGITGTANIVTGFTADEFWADFSGMGVAGSGDWIRLKVDFGGPQLAVSNLVSGQTATFTVTNTTNNGLVGIAFSLVGGGPTSVNAGSCGFLTVDMSLPFTVLGTFTAVGTTVTVNQPIPGSASGVSVWFQALDFGSCALSNGVAATVL